MLNPLVATVASPGMGKSTYIDAVASLTELQVEKLLPPPESLYDMDGRPLSTKQIAQLPSFLKALSSSIRVTVDYNGYQEVSDFDLAHPAAGLALRMLHSCVHSIQSLDSSSCNTPLLFNNYN
jgi:hypothetical protein